MWTVIYGENFRQIRTLEADGQVQGVLLSLNRARHSGRHNRLHCSKDIVLSMAGSPAIKDTV
jgi:hypothetical protein